MMKLLKINFLAKLLPFKAKESMILPPPLVLQLSDLQHFKHNPPLLGPFPGSLTLFVSSHTRIAHAREDTTSRRVAVHAHAA